jgi:hypothetical protein
MHARYLPSAAVAAVFACVLSSTGAAASTLYERLGGYDAIQAVVDQTITSPFRARGLATPNHCIC